MFFSPRLPKTVKFFTIMGIGPRSRLARELELSGDGRAMSQRTAGCSAGTGWRGPGGRCR